MTIVLPELLAGFLDEARGYVATLRQALANAPDRFDQARLQELHHQARVLSTGAGMLGLEAVAALAGEAAALVDTRITQQQALTSDDCQRVAQLLTAIDADLTDRGADMPLTAPPPAPNARANGGSLPDGFAPLADLPPELLNIFALEAQEHSLAIERGLEHLLQHPHDLDTVRDLRRATHTLKGASASVGFAQMAHIAHLMEEVLERALDSDQALGKNALNLLLDSADVIEHLMQPGAGDAGADPFTAVDKRYARLLGDAYPAQPAQPVAPDSANASPPDPQPAARVENMLRLPLADMDLFINRVGEIIINRSSLERQLGGLRRLLIELDHSTNRLRRVAHDIDSQIETALPTRSLDSDDPAFDPLELERYSLLYQLIRELEEIATDTGDINGQLHDFSGDLDGGLTRERRLTMDLQDTLLSARLVPFYEIETRLRRTVTRTARDLDKNADLLLVGFDIKVDKTILDALVDPLMHLLRNAIDHGIEPPDARRAAGKPTSGLVTLNVTRQRGRVVITLSDDGHGIDRDRVRQAAVQHGLIGAQDQPSPQQVIDLLFQEGFSLSETVTQTSGRGVGLDIVRRAVNKLQGTIAVDTQAGQGTTFTIAVPVTLAIAQTLFIESCGQQFAVPLEQIGMVLRLDDDLLAQIQRDDVLRYDGRALAVVALADFVRPDHAGMPPQYGLMVELGDQQVVALVDRVAGIHEAVVKSLGSHLRRVSGIVGATIAGDGSVTLILDLIEIVTTDRGGTAVHTRQQAGSSHPGPRRAPSSAPHVLVVDDSPSVRRVVCAFLERAGWQTTDAKDGIDALEKLGSVRPDAALVDIEMPRMNGYELLSRIKADANWKTIPVVFLTSRSAAKHRERAAQLNVDGYLVKPYSENELLQTLARVMQRQPGL